MPYGPAPYEPPETLARVPGALGGEVALRVRPGASPVYELVVDGVFAMDTAETTTEARLAVDTLARLDGATGSALTVVVAGLGLGCTLRAVLADARVAAVDVVEIEPALVGWLRDGLVPPAAGLLADARVRVTVGDARTVLAARPPRSADAVLLDVDNGPGFLVHGVNAALYATPYLRTLLAALRPGGVLAVWAAGREPALYARLTALAPTEEVVVPVERDGHGFAYALYLARPIG